MHSLSIIILLISTVNSSIWPSANDTREEILCGETLTDYAEKDGVYYHPFEISEASGSFVTISACESEPKYDTMLILYDIDGNRIGWNDDTHLCEVNPGTFKSILISGLLTPGDYYVSVTGWNSTAGDYQLEMDCVAQGEDYNSDQDPDCNFVNYNGAFDPVTNSFGGTLFEFDKCYTANYNYYFRIEVSDEINYDAISWKLECNGELNGWREYVYDGEECTEAKLVAQREVGPHFFEYNCKGTSDGCNIATYVCDDVSNEIITGVCSDGVSVQCQPQDDEYVRLYDNGDCSSSTWTVLSSTDESYDESCFDEWSCEESPDESGLKSVTLIFVLLSVYSLINL